MPNPLEMPSIASQVFSDGVVPLTAEERKGLDGMSLGDRGSAAEAYAIAHRPPEPFKLKRKRRTTKNVVPEPQVETEASLDITDVQPKRRGRPKKADTFTTVYQVAADDETVKINSAFLKEICQMEAHCFRLINDLSSGNPRLSSPMLGGVDLESGYRLQEKMEKAGLI